MKRVYMNLAGTYYKVQQSFDRILETVIPRRNAISSREDSVMNTVSISISASDMDYSNLMTNAESVNEMKKKLVADNCYEIAEVPNSYKIEIDYSIYDEKGVKRIERSKVMKDIVANDKMMTLGIDMHNECHFRVVKEFEQRIEFTNKKSVPLGIMHRKPEGCVFKINGIKIYQDIIAASNESVYEQPFKFNGNDTETDQLLEGSLCIYDSKGAGVNYEPTVIKFIPRVIELSLDIILTNYMMVYSETEINDLLQSIYEVVMAPEEEPANPTEPSESTETEETTESEHYDGEDEVTSPD